VDILQPVTGDSLAVDILQPALTYTADHYAVDILQPVTGDTLAVDILQPALTVIYSSDISVMKFI